MNNKHILRVASNYARLLASFAIGLLVIRQIAQIGASALTLYLLMLSGTGFAYFFKTILRESIIPALGLSFDGHQGRNFRELYFTSITISLIFSILSLFVFAAIYLFSAYFDTGNLSQPAVLFMIMSAAIQTVLTTATTPFLNIILIRNDIIAFNALVALERVPDLLAAMLVTNLITGSTESDKVIVFAVVSGVLYALLQYGTYLWAVSGGSKFKVGTETIRRSDVSWILQLFGWNAVVVIVFLLYSRLYTLVANVAFGMAATITISLAIQIVSMLRQAGMGLVLGLDAAVSRAFGSPALEQRASFNKVMIRTTYLQAVVACYGMVILWLFAGVIFQYWVGDRLTRNEWDIELATAIVRIMAIGFAARTISEGWMKYLAGKGRVRTYAEMLLLGGIPNLLALALIVYFLDLHDGLLAMAVVFTIIHVAVHLVVMPVVVARDMNIRLDQLYLPVLTPALGALSSFLIIQGPLAELLPVSVWGLATTVLLMGLIFAVDYLVSFKILKVAD